MKNTINNIKMCYNFLMEMENTTVLYIVQQGLE